MLVEILREDLSHIIKKPDVWLVYTKKLNRPFVCVPDSMITNTDTDTFTFTLDNRGERHD